MLPTRWTARGTAHDPAIGSSEAAQIDRLVQAVLACLGTGAVLNSPDASNGAMQHSWSAADNFDDGQLQRAGVSPAP